jgi:hypothetical protein
MKLYKSPLLDKALDSPRLKTEVVSKIIESQPGVRRLECLAKAFQLYELGDLKSSYTEYKTAENYLRILNKHQMAFSDDYPILDGRRVMNDAYSLDLLYASGIARIAWATMEDPKALELEIGSKTNVCENILRDLVKRIDEVVIMRKEFKGQIYYFNDGLQNAIRIFKGLVKKPKDTELEVPGVCGVSAGKEISEFENLLLMKRTVPPAPDKIAFTFRSEPIN